MTIDQRIRVQAAKTAEEQIERSAKMYESNPRLLDMIDLDHKPPLSQLSPAELRRNLVPRFAETWIEGINLKGALRYASRLEQNK